MLFIKKQATCGWLSFELFCDNESVIKCLFSHLKNGSCLLMGVMTRASWFHDPCYFKACLKKITPSLLLWHLLRKFHPSIKHTNKSFLLRILFLLRYDWSNIQITKSIKQSITFLKARGRDV